MPRPQKYSDLDIASAIQSLVAAGEPVSTQRVKAALGGGNIDRIKAVIAREAEGTDIPPPISREFQRVSADVSEQILALASRCWAIAAKHSSTDLREENARLRKQIDFIGKQLSHSSAQCAQMKLERDEAANALERSVSERDRALKDFESLEAALRNAESDVRASQKTIDNYERGQRADREDMRRMQKRIEELVAELSSLQTTRSSVATRPRSGKRR